MKNIWKNQKLSIITIVFLILVILSILFLIRPLVARIKEKSDNIQKKIIDNQVSKERISQIPQMEEMDKMYEDRKKELDVILDVRDEVGLIKKLEALADETGNKMTLKVDDAGNIGNNKANNTNTGKKDEKKGIKDSLSYDNYISMQINLTGDYPELVNFIYKLENFDYYVNVISVESKKDVQVSENSTTVPPPKAADIFAVPTSPSSSQTQPQVKIEKTEKDIINNTINVIIYTKK